MPADIPIGEGGGEIGSTPPTARVASPGWEALVWDESKYDWAKRTVKPITVCACTTSNRIDALRRSGKTSGLRHGISTRMFAARHLTTLR